jgi:hypothetical protein
MLPFGRHWHRLKDNIKVDINTTLCEVKLCPSLQQQQVHDTFNQPVYSHKILIITNKYLKLWFQLYWIHLGKIWEMFRPFGNNIIKHSVPPPPKKSEKFFVGHRTHSTGF